MTLKNFTFKFTINILKYSKYLILLTIKKIRS